MGRFPVEIRSMQKVTVLNPSIAGEAADAPLAPQLTHLRDVKIAFVDNSKLTRTFFSPGYVLCWRSSTAPARA